MMKKEYITPEAEIEKFTIADILTTSPTEGMGEGGNEGGDLDDQLGGLDGTIEF